MDLGNLAEWAGAAGNFLVAGVAVGVVLLQRCWDRAKEKSRIASTGVSAATNALAALKLVEELQVHIEKNGPTGALGIADWRFKLEVAAGTLRVSLGQEHRDPALIQSLIEAQAWLSYAIEHLDDAAWLWSRLPTNEGEREQLSKTLRSMMRQLLMMVER